MCVCVCVCQCSSSRIRNRTYWTENKNTIHYLVIFGAYRGREGKVPLVIDLDTAEIKYIYLEMVIRKVKAVFALSEA
jgi:hypothetical protein